MLGDFNLHHLLFPDMCTNTVFMYLMAMCATLFEWIKTVLVANKARAIKVTIRVKGVLYFEAIRNALHKQFDALVYSDFNLFLYSDKVCDFSGYTFFLQQCK